jgi:ribosome-associated protein
MEGDDAGDWVLVDFSHVVVHVMLPEMRDFYDLERLWANPEVID